MRKVMFALVLGLLSSTAIPASAQSNSPAAGFFGGAIAEAIAICECT